MYAITAEAKCAHMPHRSRGLSGEILPPRPCCSPRASTGTSPTTVSRPSGPLRRPKGGTTLSDGEGQGRTRRAAVRSARLLACGEPSFVRAELAGRTSRSQSPALAHSRCELVRRASWRGACGDVSRGCRLAPGGGLERWVRDRRRFLGSPAGAAISGYCVLCNTISDRLTNDWSRRSVTSEAAGRTEGL
jgi:hypothetical protein